MSSLKSFRFDRERRSASTFRLCDSVQVGISHSDQLNKTRFAQTVEICSCSCQTCWWAALDGTCRLHDSYYDSEFKSDIIWNMTYPGRKLQRFYLSSPNFVLMNRGLIQFYHEEATIRPGEPTKFNFFGLHSNKLIVSWPGRAPNQAAVTPLESASKIYEIWWFVDTRAKRSFFIFDLICYYL